MKRQGRAGAPLQGVVVLDLTQIYNGPYATFLMAMAGADVVKIEPPDGEHLRRRTQFGWNNSPFADSQRENEVLSWIQDWMGRQVLPNWSARPMSRNENYAPGVMAGWNLGADTLHQTNPRP